MNTLERDDAAQATRLTFRSVLRSAFRTLTDLDFASARTVIGLAVKPGEVARSYINGERGRVMNPIKFAFLATTLYVVFNAVTASSDMEVFLDPLMSNQAFWPYLSLVLLLPAAALQRVLFREQSCNAAECYAFALFVFGELALFGTLLLGIQRVLSVQWTAWIGLTLAGAYSAWAVTGLYQDRRASVWLRALFVFGAVIGAVAQILVALVRYRFSGSVL